MVDTLHHVRVWFVRIDHISASRRIAKYLIVEWHVIGDWVAPKILVVQRCKQIHWSTRSIRPATRSAGRASLEAGHETKDVASVVVASASYVYCFGVAAYVRCAKVVGCGCCLQ